MSESLLQGSSGSYELTGTIREGGMGTVHTGRVRETGLEVAVKTLKARFSADRSVCAKFMRGAKVHAELSDHPNIVKAIDYFRVGFQPYMVMEFVNGPSVEDVLQAQGLMPPQRAIPIFVQVLDAVGYAHSNEVIHRDIKPSNILLAPGDIPKVSDFDIGKRIGSGGLTEFGQRLGTRPYMSPEQTYSSTDLGVTSDIYSLGATLYEMVTNRQPFDDENPQVLYEKIRRDAPVPPSQIYHFLPSELEKAILVAMEKDPAKRYQSTDEFRETLVAIPTDIIGNRETVPDEWPTDSGPETRIYGYLMPEGGDDTSACPVTRRGVRMGRGSPNTIVTPEDDPRVSRSHAWVVPLDLGEEGVYVLDMGSMNGTFVNNLRVETGVRIELQEGDLIELGRHGSWRFRFRLA
jgi:serine/threonine protein kinase